MADRFKELEKLHARDPNDPFLRYALAMEHKKAGRLEDSLAWMSKTLEADPSYCYAYYQQGQVYEELGDADAARKAYDEGIVAARACNDLHAVGELQVALDLMGD